MIGEYSTLTPGTHRLPCPTCNKGPKDQALAVTVEADGQWVAYCHRCHYSAHSGGAARVIPLTQPKASRKRIGLSDWARELWQSCSPIGGIAADYLHARHCVMPPTDGDLRYHSHLKHPSGYIGAALVALITDQFTGKPLSLHRAWIHADGTKATNPAKMMLGGHPIPHGVIRLWPDECVTYGLGIAEGIETALSLAWGFKPVWSLIDAGHMGKFEPLPGIECLTIAMDNDAAGIKTANECAKAWSRAGAEVRITRQTANDLNDIAREAAA